MSTRYTKHTKQNRLMEAVFLVLFCALLLWSGVAQARTEITNSVSVEASSSNGDGTASVSVETIHNGAVVESYTETSTDGSIEYSSTQVLGTDGAAETTVHASESARASEHIDGDAAHIAELQEILRMLEALVFTLTQALSR